MPAFTARPLARAVLLSGDTGGVGETLLGNLNDIGWRRAAAARDAGCLLHLGDGCDGADFAAAARAFAAGLPPEQAGVAVFIALCRGRADRFAQSQLAAGLQALALDLAPALRVNGIVVAHGGADDLPNTLRFVLAVPALTGQMIVLGDPSAAHSGKSPGP